MNEYNINKLEGNILYNKFINLKESKKTSNDNLILPYFNHIFYKNNYNIKNFNKLLHLYANYCSFGKENNYLPNFIPDLDKSIQYIEDYCLKELIKEYNLKYNFGSNVLPLLYYSENAFSDNFLLQKTDIIINKNMYFLHFILNNLITELFKNNIEWKYLIYTEKSFEIEAPLFSNYFYTVYKVKKQNKIKKNYNFLLENLNNDSNIYITTHQKLFIKNIFNSKINKIIKPYNNCLDYLSFVLTVNKNRYDIFMSNIEKKNININFYKFSGIKKSYIDSIKKIENFNSGHFACLLGHYIIIKDNIDKNQNILIVEDDCEFCDNFNNRWNNIKEYLDNNLDKWELFIGSCLYNIYPSECINYKNENIIKYTNNVSTNFVYYNKNILKKHISYIENILFDIIDNENSIYDRFIRLFNTYTTIPFLTSEIENNISDITESPNYEINNNYFNQSQKIAQLIIDKVYQNNENVVNNS